jgi:hypothetical protein
MKMLKKGNKRVAVPMLNPLRRRLWRTSMKRLIWVEMMMKIFRQPSKRLHPLTLPLMLRKRRREVLLLTKRTLMKIKIRKRVIRKAPRMKMMRLM